jgi:Endopolygalacturonase
MPRPDIASVQLAVDLPAAGRTTTTLAAYVANNAAFNVKDYGAVGDNTADDTAALVAAVAAANAVSTGAGGGACVLLPPGAYRCTTPLVLHAGTRLVGAGSFASFLVFTGTTGFALTLGTGGTNLSYGTGVEDLGVLLASAGASGIWLRGVADCALRNVYVEGSVGTSSSTGVQIDGASSSAFFIVMTNVHCNHVFKGFVHTTTGAVQPTQVTGINCAATCDNTAGSTGIEVQSVGGVGCGDGVVYLGGNMESCQTGVRLEGSGTLISGMRFENPHGTSSDISFGSTARNNTIIGGSGCYTIADSAVHPSNQIFGVAKDEVNSISQQNVLDGTRFASQITEFRTPTSTDWTYLITPDTSTGALSIQNGPGSAALGGALNLYGSRHPTKPGDVAVGVTSGGKFRVNGLADDGGSDWLTTDTISGYSTLYGVTITHDLRHVGTKTGLNGNPAIPKAAAIASPTAPSANYVQAEAQAMKTAVDAIRVALANIGITA